MTYCKIVGASALALALAVPVALSPMLASPAHAQLFGFCRIVYDPSNYAQNVLTAARTLEQISNQITSLQAERRREHIAELQRRATESELRLKRLYDAIEAGIADLDDPALKDRIDGLKAIR